jgi:isoleucyl-tRNA synthetase
MAKAMSALLPLVSEAIYLGLMGKNAEALKLEEGEISVHLCDFPKLLRVKVNHELVTSMDTVLDICSNSLFVRSSENIRVRQPLASIKIISKNNDPLKGFANLIKDEINVKSVIYQSDLENYAAQKLSIKFPVLGKRLPHKMKDIIAASKRNEWAITDNGLIISGEKLKPDEYKVVLEPHHSVKGAKAFLDNSALLILDLELTPELIEEGIARDLIRFIQQARRDADFLITDRILIEITGDLDLTKIIIDYGDFIMEQTLGEFKNGFKADYTSEIELEGQKIQIKICKE